MTEITPKESIVPIYLVPLTPEQEAEREQWALEEQARLNAEYSAEEARASARESARAKLSKLGLTEDEVSALLGT